MQNMMMNPMQLKEQINQFKQSINGNPEQIVKSMIQSGQVSQAQLNQAQALASQIMAMMQK